LEVSFGQKYTIWWDYKEEENEREVHDNLQTILEKILSILNSFPGVTAKGCFEHSQNERVKPVFGFNVRTYTLIFRFIVRPVKAIPHISVTCVTSGSCQHRRGNTNASVNGMLISTRVIFQSVK